MRRAFSLLLIVSLLFLSRAAGAFELGNLDWALGAWRGPIDGAVMQKYFFHPDADTFFIFTRVISGERTVYWDFITLEGSGEDYRLTQYSNGQKGDSYKLVESGKDFAVFRNPESRKVVEVAYKKEGSNLASSIKFPGQDAARVFRYERIPLSLSGPSAVEPDPAAVAPEKYKTLLNDEAVRILDFRLGPGERVPVHSHPRYVMHALTPFQIRFCSKDTGVALGNSCRDFSGAAGDTIESPALTHADENIGKDELHVLLFEFKR